MGRVTPIENKLNQLKPELHVPLDFYQQIAIGRVLGWRAVSVFGRNPAVGQSDEDIWEYGGVRTYPSAAAVISLTSDDPADTSGGTGAKTVYITGLDSNWNEISETVALSGATPATTTQQFLRVNYANVATCGTSGTNVGNITGTISGAVNVYITASDGIAHSAHYSIPANHRAYLVRFDTWQGKDAATNTRMYARNDSGSGPWLSLGHAITYRSQTSIVAGMFEVLPGNSDIKIVSAADAGSADQSVYYSLVLQDLDI